MYLKEVSQKNKDGTLRTYLQLVESRRINGKPRQVLLVNLGRVDGYDGKEKIEKLTEALVEASRANPYHNPRPYLNRKTTN